MAEGGRRRRELLKTVAPQRRCIRALTRETFISPCFDEHTRSCLSINDGQENARVSAAEEGEVSSEAGTLLNVVPGSIRAKPELHEANMCSAVNAVTC